MNRIKYRWHKHMHPDIKVLCRKFSRLKPLHLETYEGPTTNPPPTSLTKHCTHRPISLKLNFLRCNLLRRWWVGWKEGGGGGGDIISFCDTCFLLIWILYDTQSFRLINHIISGVLCYFHDYFGSIGRMPGHRATCKQQARFFRN